MVGIWRFEVSKRGTNALVCSEPAEQWGAPAPIGANCRKDTVKPLLDLIGALVYLTKQTISCLTVMTNQPGWASHWLCYMFKYILLSGLSEKSLYGIFFHCTVTASLPLWLVDAHRALSVRESGDTSQLLGPLRTSSLSAHASVIMAVSHNAGWQRLTVGWVALKTRMGSVPLGHSAGLDLKGDAVFFLFIIHYW